MYRPLGPPLLACGSATRAFGGGGVPPARLGTLLRPTPQAPSLPELPQQLLEPDA
jgi:hypothetical protein